MNQSSALKIKATWDLENNKGRLLIYEGDKLFNVYATPSTVVNPVQFNHWTSEKAKEIKGYLKAWENIIKRS